MALSRSKEKKKQNKTNTCIGKQTHKQKKPREVSEHSSNY